MLMVVVQVSFFLLAIQLVFPVLSVSSSSCSLSWCNLLFSSQRFSPFSNEFSNRCQVDGNLSFLRLWCYCLLKKQMSFD